MENNLRTHSLAHELVTSTMTKEELDKRMDNLSDSGFRNDWRDSASCYLPAPRLRQRCNITCSKCGSPSELVYTSRSRECNLAEEYDKIAREFVSLGYQAETKYYCEKCVAEDPGHLSPVTFTFYADGMIEPIISYPCPRHCSTHDYELALDFLKGAQCAGTLKDLQADEENEQFKYVRKIRKIIGPEPQHNKPETDDREQQRTSPF